MQNVSQMPMLEADIVEIRQQAAQMIADKVITQGKMSTESGVNATRLSQFLNNKYPGDNAEIGLSLQRWMRQRDEKAKQANTLPDAPSFILTPTAQKVLNALVYAQIAADITVIYGGAGLGKTQSIREHAANENNVWVATMTPSTSTVGAALEEIALSVGIKAPSGRPARNRRDISNRMMGTEGLLIIDEAQHLSTPALDEIRSLHDATGIGIALIGNEAIYSNMTGGKRAAYLDRLFSRIGKRVKLSRPLKSDVKAIADAWNINQKSAEELLVQIGLKPGGLRGVTKTLRLAAMFAAGQDEALSHAHIEAAWKDLGGAA